MLLYNPPIQYYTGRRFAMLPVLGIAILAAVLNEAGHEARVEDLDTGTMKPEQLGLIFRNMIDPPDVVGFTCLSAAARGTKECIAAIRKAGYTGTIVVGGIHPTVRPVEAYEWGADLVVTGECEGNIVELLEGGYVGIHEGKRMPIDEIPSPDWDNYTPGINYPGQYKILENNTTVAMWSRGCPYGCIFCGDLIFNKQKTRYRSPEIIEREMRDIRDRGVKNVYVYDDEIIGIPQPDGWMREIADRIEPLKMKWIAQGRCSKKYATREQFEDMYRAGCRLISWGVESFSEQVQRNMKKNLTQDDIWHTLKLSHEAGIENNVYTIIGSYKETEKDLAITAKALQKGAEMGVIDYHQTFLCKSMPGTELEAIAEKENWNIANDLFVGWTTVPEEGTPWLTKDEILKWKSIISAACPRIY